MEIGDVKTVKLQRNNNVVDEWLFTAIQLNLLSSLICVITSSRYTDGLELQLRNNAPLITDRGDFRGDIFFTGQLPAGTIYLRFHVDNCCCCEWSNYTAIRRLALHVM